MMHDGSHAPCAQHHTMYPRLVLRHTRRSLRQLPSALLAVQPHSSAPSHAVRCGRSVWLARAHTRRGFTVKVAEYATLDMSPTTSHGPPLQSTGHPPPELLLEVSTLNPKPQTLKP